ncbi:MAG TPA: hypothetical protein VJ782_02200 [Aeromicrobium sp.]|nr:hypothetical protein [Aeromicrobium sp.]
MTITDSNEQWATWLAHSVRDANALQGNPLTAEQVERAYVEALETFAGPSRYDPTADIDPDIDPGHCEPELADRQAAIEWGRATGVDR